MAYSLRLESLRDLIELYCPEIEILDRRIHLALKDDRGYKAIQAIHGVGPVLAAVLVAEIGDASRFRSPDQLCAWAGLTPRHRESDTKVRRGSITKQGCQMERWAAIEAISRNHGGDKIKADYRRISERRGRVAAARKVLRLVYYGLRDREIRCLAPAEAGWASSDAASRPARGSA